MQRSTKVNQSSFQRDREMETLCRGVSGLQEGLQRMTSSYQELGLRYETDMQTAKLQVEILENELVLQSQAHAERASQDRQVLQEGLERLRVFHQELCQRYEADVQSLRQQAETQQQELKAEIKSLHDKIADDQVKIWTMSTDNCILRHKMMEVVDALQQTSNREQGGLRSQFAPLLQHNTDLMDYKFRVRRSIKRRKKWRHHLLNGGNCSNFWTSGAI